MPFDDLVRLAPIRPHFTERLHLLSLQLKVCSGNVGSFAGAIAFIDDVDETKNTKFEREHFMCMGQPSHALVRHAAYAMTLLEPLVDTCGKFAYTPKIFEQRKSSRFQGACTCGYGLTNLSVIRSDSPIAA